MSKNARTYFLVGLAFLIGVGIGLSGNKLFAPRAQTPVSSPTADLYTSQTAVIRGQIIKVTRDSITVKNSNTGVVGDIKVASSLVITKFNSGTKPVASSSSNLRDIDLDKDALVSLEMIDGSYQATLIQFTSPPPSIPPVASPTPNRS